MTAYASLADLRARLGFTSGQTGDDAILLAVLEAVTLAINDKTHRRFQPATQTRYYTAIDAHELLVDDLLSVTTLKTDDDGDRTYDETWTATDFDLEPYNAASEDPPQPYTSLAVTPDGDYTFPANVAKGVQIAGSWGVYDVRATSTSTLAEALDASEVGVDVSSGTPFSAGQTILIDSEQMYITSISSNTLTVRRGRNGTTAATHDSGATIQVYEYPVVHEACLLQAAHVFRLKDAPGGVLGSAEAAQVNVRLTWDPIAWRLLSSFRRPAIG